MNNNVNAQPYFRFGCTEINGAQVFAYLGCGSADARIRVLEEPCAILSNDPDTGDVRVWEDPVSDGAAWYDPEFPESEDFLGIYILGITGTDSPLNRSVEQRAGGLGGAVLGPLRARPRGLGFEAVAFARSEAAMEYGMRWFTDAMRGDACDPCSPCDAEVRLSCSEDDTGRWTLRSVGLATGPTWGDIPVPGLGCLMRTVNWAIASKYPHLFKCPTTLLDEEPLFTSGGCSPIEDWLTTSATVQTTLESLPISGETCGVVSVYSGDSEIVARITGRAKGVAPLPTFDPDSTAPDSSIVLDFHVTIPKSSTMVYDGAIQKVILESPGGAQVDGTRYVVVPSGETLCWPVVRCGAIELNVSLPLHDATDATRVTVESVYRTL